MNLILKSIMFLTVVIAEPEGDGSFNYLLERSVSGTRRQYSIAFSSPTDSGLKPGDSFYAYVNAECQEVWALDDNSKPTDLWESFGAPRRVYICNANSITIDEESHE